MTTTTTTGTALTCRYCGAPYDSQIALGNHTRADHPDFTLTPAWAAEVARRKAAADDARPVPDSLTPPVFVPDSRVAPS